MTVMEQSWKVPWELYKKLENACEQHLLEKARRRVHWSHSSILSPRLLREACCGCNAA
ncbi:hypothetical protein J4457_07470 [Candidatus Woesearchaeota archaeon]|nr:hypothetical protein [Candidatus Woesearchaeota archaeon]